jgi:hypothetical protein
MFMAGKNFIRRLIEAVDRAPFLIWVYVAAAVIGSLVMLLEFMD